MSSTIFKPAHSTNSFLSPEISPPIPPKAGQDPLSAPLRTGAQAGNDSPTLITPLWSGASGLKSSGAPACVASADAAGRRVLCG